MRIRTWLLGLSFVFLGAASAEAQRQCSKGKVCGNTCIAASKTCRVGKAEPLATPDLATKAAAAVSDTSARWVGSKRGSLYYRIGCSGVKRLAVANRVFFRSEDDAQQAGYTRSRTRGC